MNKICYKDPFRAKYSTWNIKISLLCSIACTSYFLGLSWIYEPRGGPQSGGEESWITLPLSLSGQEDRCLGSLLNVCCSMRWLCWSWCYRQFCIMNSLRLASNDGQIYKDKNQYRILKVTIAFVNNSVFISDLCESWMAWASKSFLRLQ